MSTDAIETATEAADEPKLYVQVELLSARPHPLPRGAEAQDAFEPEVLEALLEAGVLRHERPDGGDV